MQPAQESSSRQAFSHAGICVQLYLHALVLWALHCIAVCATRDGGGTSLALHQVDIRTSKVEIAKRIDA